jgi:hypothetical protein
MILILLACVTEPAEYVYGINLSEIEFELYDLDMGVYPNNSLGDDPNNPFAELGLAGDDRWDIYPAGPVQGFYAFGTHLLSEPSGEAQFYTASAAHQIYVTGQAPDEDLWAVREIAVAGYLSVIENFPGDVTYDITGTIATPVGPLAEDGLSALGGTP